MDRVIWFTNARFGMFIHWGLYAIPAEGEWIFANRDWKDGEYQSLMKQFNPVDYDPAEWAALAKARTTTMSRAASMQSVPLHCCS